MSSNRSALYRVATVLILAVSLPCPGRAELMDYKDGIGIQYGIGMDTIVYEGRRSPLVPTAVMPAPGQGQSRETDVWRMETSSDMEQLFGASAELGYSIPVLGGGTSLKTTYLKRHTLSAYTLSYVIRSSVWLPETMVQSPQLNNEARGILAQGAQGFPMFRSSFGDGFVRGIVSGGEYYGVINIKTSSEGDMRAVSSTLKNSYLGANATASFTSASSQVSTVSEMTVNQVYHGGPALPTPNSAADLARNADTQAQYLLTHPTSGTPISVDVADYLMFPEYYGVYIDLGYERRALLAELQRNYLEYVFVQNTLQYIENNQQEFRFNPATRNAVLAEIRTKKNQINSVLAQIDQRYFQVSSGQSSATTLAALGVQPAADFSLTLRLPPRYWAALRWPPEKAGPPAYWEEKIPPQSMYPLPGPTRGDGEMKGHKPRTTITAWLELGNAGKTLTLKYAIEMREGKADWTTFRDSRSVLLVDLRGRGYSIKRLVGPTRGDIVWVAPEDYHDWRTVTPSNPAASIIRLAKCRSDTSGNDRGKLGCTDIVFNNVGVEYVHDEDIPTGSPPRVQPYYDEPATAARPSPVTRHVFGGKFVPVNRNVMMRPKRAVQAVPSQTRKLPVPTKQVAQPAQRANPEQYRREQAVPQSAPVQRVQRTAPILPR